MRTFVLQLRPLCAPETGLPVLMQYHVKVTENAEGPEKALYRRRKI